MKPLKNIKYFLNFLFIYQVPSVHLEVEDISPQVTGKSNINYSNGHQLKMVKIIMSLYLSLVYNFVNKCRSQ